MLKRIAFGMLLLSLFFVEAMAQPLDKVVAIVNEGIITASELNAQATLLRQELAAKQVPTPSDALLQKQALQHLIDVNLQLQLAKQHEIAINDNELDETLTKIAENNHLSLAQLQEAVEREGLKWNFYRENIRKDMLLARIQQNAVAQTVTIPEDQVQETLKILSEEEKAQQLYTLQNIIIPLPEKASPAQMKRAKQKATLLLQKARKESNLNRLALSETDSDYMLESNEFTARHLNEFPSLYAQKIIKMQVGEVVGPLQAGNGLQLIKLVSVDASHLQHEVTKTHVRHILIKAGASLPAAEAKIQADNLYQQLLAGKNFAELAKKYSADTPSAVKGGDLGWVSGEELVPPFEKAMDSLPAHRLSKPVQSKFGWHIIEVLERKKVDDSASYKLQQARLLLQQRKFAEAVQIWQQRLRANAYINILDKQLA